MSSPTANCRLFGDLQYGPSPRRSQFVADFGLVDRARKQSVLVNGGAREIRTRGMVLGHIERLWGARLSPAIFQDPITQPNASADEIITRDDSVAILATKKAAPEGAAFQINADNSASCLGCGI